MLKEIPLVFNHRPVYYLLHVTSKCNAECSHCFYWEDIRDGKMEQDIKLSDFEKLSKSMGDVLVVNLCGAEAHLRKDLPDIAHLFSKNNHCKLMTVPSNGYLTGQILENIERMCSENPQTFFRFAFSLDGPKEIHDQIRGVEGLFDRACETIRQVAELKKQYSNFVLITSTVFSSETQGHILSFLDWIKLNLPVEQTNVTFVRGNPMIPETKEVDSVIYEQVLEKIQKDARLEAKDKSLSSILPYAMFLKTMETVKEAYERPGERVFACYAGKKFVVIDRKGFVYPCEQLDESSQMGFLGDYDWNIQDLLTSEKVKSVTKWVREEHCACTWECAIQSSKLFDVKEWPALGVTATKVALGN